MSSPTARPEAPREVSPAQQARTGGAFKVGDRVLVVGRITGEWKGAAGKVVWTAGGGLCDVSFPGRRTTSFLSEELELSVQEQPPGIPVPTAQDLGT